jgi:hypothetical protein
MPLDAGDEASMALDAGDDATLDGGTGAGCAGC